MELRKFPVVKDGINYEVEIVPHDTTEFVWEVTLYIHKEINFFGLFKKTFKKKLLEKYYGLEEYRYYYTDIEYLDELSFIKMTHNVVSEYVSTVTKETECNSICDKAIKDFKTWDGMIK